jgi:hypothetical protein
MLSLSLFNALKKFSTSDALEDLVMQQIINETKHTYSSLQIIH